MVVNTNTVFSFFSFTGFLLCSIPLYWHIEAWNVGTCMYMIWTGLACLMYFINSVVWAGNTVNWAPVWCDISSRFIIGINVALPTASLCINRRLYHIANPTSATTKTRSEKRRGVVVDLSICLGIPVLQMILQYVVEGHRFTIFEDIGCFPDTYNTYLAYPLVWAWPLTIGVVSAVYCTLTLIAFMKRRKQFRDLISCNTNLTYSRYFRLMALASIEMLAAIPLSIYVICLNTSTALGVAPWISWDNVHFNYSRVFQIPKSIYEQDSSDAMSLQLSRWLPVSCAIVFFGFFGFADEAKKHYRIAFTSVARRVGYTTISSGLSSSATASFAGKHGFMGSKGGLSVSLPVRVTKDTEISRDSMSSYSDKLSTSIYIGEASVLDDVRVQPYSPTDTSEPNSPMPPSPVGVSYARRQELSVDLSSIRKPSVPDAPKSAYPDSVLDIA